MSERGKIDWPRAVLAGAVGILAARGLVHEKKPGPEITAAVASAPKESVYEPKPVYRGRTRAPGEVPARQVDRPDAGETDAGVKE